MPRISATLAALFLATAATAEPPEILDARIEKTGTSSRIEVTIRHPDTGWDHYAAGWEVLDTDGTRLGHRELHHPHVEVQPFTRALTGIDLPDGTREVFIRAHCSVDGWTEDTVRIVVQP